VSKKCWVTVAFIVGLVTTGCAPAKTVTSVVHPTVKATAQSVKARKQTVTFKVTGSAANVTYGPSGSMLTGKVPMTVTEPLAVSLYYALEAQLKGSGSVTTEILVDGKIISRGTADGGYNVASAEISMNPITGVWGDD
jgi:hypothetical protein